VVFEEKRLPTFGETSFGRGSTIIEKRYNSKRLDVAKSKRKHGGGGGGEEVVEA